MTIRLIESIPTTLTGAGATNMHFAIKTGAILAICGLWLGVAASQEPEFHPVPQVEQDWEDPAMTVDEDVVDGRAAPYDLKSWEIRGTDLPLISLLTDEYLHPVINPDVLPATQDPNDLQAQPVDARASVQVYRLTFFNTRYDDSSDVKIPLGLQVRPGLYYDTGAGGGNGQIINPQNIALDGTPEAHGRGQITFSPDGEKLTGFVIPVRPQVGMQVADFASLGSVQAHLDAISPTGNDLRARSVFLRFVTTPENVSVAFGKVETLFGDLGSVPTTFTTGALPVGTVSVSQSGTNAFISVAQFRASYYSSGLLVPDDILEVAASAEDPAIFDNAEVGYPADVTRLNRYPILVGRVRYGGSNRFDSYQVATLVRPFGFETNSDFSEHFATGWGISGNARFDFGDGERTDTVYVGAVGGRAIGGYIYGGTPSALITNPRDIETLWNFGAYASFRHVWYAPGDGSSWSSNAIYGVVVGQQASATDNRRLEQVGCNLLWNSGNNASVGLEYQYAARKIVDGGFGDNHRLMLVFQFGVIPSSTPDATNVRTNALYRGEPTASYSPSSTKSRLRL